MATTKNITMKQFNGTDYDTLYPKTKVEQIENLTPSSIGAVNKSGDTMTGNLVVPTLSVAQNVSAGYIYGETNSLNFRGGNPNTGTMHYLGIKDSGVYVDNNLVCHNGNLLSMGKSMGIAQIAIGSYVGTGTSDYAGGTKQNSLTFDFEPKVLAVVADGGNMFFPGFLIVRGQTYSNGIGSFSSSSVALNLHITWSGNTVSWWSSNRTDVGTKYPQMNAENITYCYVALG